MRSSSQWPCIINDLRREQSVSVRSLAIRTGVHRTRLGRFLNGKPSNFKISEIERLLSVFGYELEAIKRPDSEAA
ncbi:helix-turn-helix transcriptional regulator [Mesorhizobium sp. SB112]|uniref:helix-turn-helix domain-containing protein n=1 Tax=Mesorhizobium sp. SB112 TaxID=3151853 RepID=UPI003267424A